MDGHRTDIEQTSDRWTDRHDSGNTDVQLRKMNINPFKMRYVYYVSELSVVSKIQVIKVKSM